MAEAPEAAGIQRRRREGFDAVSGLRRSATENPRAAAQSGFLQGI
jgi:hypothetical protein